MKFYVIILIILIAGCTNYNDIIINDSIELNDSSFNDSIELNDSSFNDSIELNDSNFDENNVYSYELNWWLKPQTYGMFNYYVDTNIERLRITNNTVNGYRLVYDLNNFDYLADIKKVHEKGIKYVMGFLFKNTDELGNCLPLNLIRNDSLNKAKQMINLGIDGLVIIQPFQDSFIDNEMTCLCLDNENTNKEEQLNCAVKFYSNFTKEIKKISNIPIGIASHGEWLIPLTINMMSNSDFVFANLNFESNYHSFLYKLQSSISNNSKLITAPTDMSFGWLIEDSLVPEDLIQIKMAEAYSNKGAFQDQYAAGLSPSCFGQNHFEDNCWLDASINASTINEINSFYLNNKELFNLSLQSLSKIGVLVSAKSIKDNLSQHWSLFNDVSRTLSELHFQYDVIFSEDSSFSLNTLDLEKLQKYELIILPNNNIMDENVILLLNNYVKTGGKIILINQVDSNINFLKEQFPYQVRYLGNEYFTNGPQELTNLVDNMINRTVENNFSKKIDIQLWNDSNKIILHLVNHDFDLNTGVIEKFNIPISININLNVKKVRLLSLNINDSSLNFTYNDSKLNFIVPKLKIWDTIIIE